MFPPNLIADTVMAVAGLSLAGVAFVAGRKTKAARIVVRHTPKVHTHDLLHFTTESTAGYTRKLYRCRDQACGYQVWVSSKESPTESA